MLVYKIYLFSNHRNNNEIGYIDAHSSKVVLTEPSYVNYAAIGTFATRYSGSRQGVTDFYSESYHLTDSTRGAIIHTWNLQGNTDIQYAIELSDQDNNWTTAEHSPNENDMALDVHWALQQIYDYMSTSYHIYSFDDDNYPIDAYIRYGTYYTDRDNAGWIGSLNVLIFGDGVIDFSPVACLDVVAHEFGHGVTDFQIGWGDSGDPRAFSEGLSDIWGVIFENRIRPDSIWQIGEQITLNASCLRNLRNTNAPNVLMPIADSLGSLQYETGGPYERSGVFSHWFYLLVNGGDVFEGIGINAAEEIIKSAVFYNYLDNTESYFDIRSQMISVASNLYGKCSTETKNVINAWNAVGVGPAWVNPEYYLDVTYTQDCNTIYISIYNLDTWEPITWTATNGLLINGNSSPYVGYGSTVSINSTNGLGGTVSALLGDACTTSYFDFCPCPTWYGATINWIWGSPAPGEPLIAEVSPLHPDAAEYNWYIGDQLIETTYDGYLQTYNWPCTDELPHLYVAGITWCGQTELIDGGEFFPLCGGYKSSLNIIIYPNPASDEVQVTLNESGTTDLSESVRTNGYFVNIFDLNGNNVYADKVTGTIFKLSVSKLKNGTYNVIVTDNKSIWQGILLVAH
jgi:hypothetical protein